MSSNAPALWPIWIERGGGVLYKDLKYNVGSIEIEHLMFVNFLLKRYT